MAVKQSIARPARTAGQGGLAFAIVEVVDAFGADLTTRQYGAVLLLLTILVGAAQVLLENRLGIALLRTLPPKEVDLVETDDDDDDDLVVTLVGPGDPEGVPVQTDNSPRDEDGDQYDEYESGLAQPWSGTEMR